MQQIEEIIKFLKSDIEGSVCRQKSTLEDLTTGNFATFRQSSSAATVADQRKAWIMYIGTGPSILGGMADKRKS